MVQNGAASVPSWVSWGVAAIGSTVQKSEAGRAGRTIPATTSVWPAVRSREPTCRPSRAAVPVVTATPNVSWPPWEVTTAGIEPAVSTDRLARPLR